MSKGAGKKLIFLFAVLLALVVFACVSVSKFVLTDKKELVGAYTDFVLSHDGAGQTAVLRQTGTTATGYIAVTVSNFADEKVSRRNVRFMMRPPVSGEISDGYVTDAWGVNHNVTAESSYYDVEIVDENDNVVSGTSDVTILEADVKNSVSLLLKITRKASAPAMEADGIENFSIVLETSEPYKDLQVFTVNTTMARLSVGVSSDVYNGYDRKIVNLKAAVDFVRNATVQENSSYLAEVEFSLVGEVVFDAVYYEEEYGFAPVYNAGRDKVTLTVRAGADVYLSFYVTGTCNVAVSATVYDGLTQPGAEKVSGVSDNKIVFATA